MSSAERTLTGLLLLALAGITVAGLWFGFPVPKPETPPPTPTAKPAASPTPTPTPVRPPPGYRLAGVAQSGTTFLAVIENPKGRQSLHRVDDEVAGLGRVSAIGDDSVTIAVEGGDFVLRVGPAATPTRANARPLNSTPRPRGPAPAGESSPSASPDRPAS